MNDFTKEELQLLEFGLSVINLWGSAYGELKKIDGKSLRTKLQSMIDNYCEHEWMNSPRLDWLYACMKCHKEICKRCKHDN